MRIWPVPGEIFWKAQQRLPRWIEGARAPVRFCIVRLARPPSSGRRNSLTLPRRRAASLNASWRHSPAVPRTAGRAALAGRWNIGSRCPSEAGGRRASPRPSGRPVEHRLPAATVRPAERKPAPAPARPADVRPVAPPYVTPARARAVEHGPAPAPVPAAPMEHSPAPAPATLTEYWLATGGRAPAAMAGTVPHTEEKIPYNSLMDALGRATPAMLTEAEKAGLPVPVPAIRSPRTMASPEKAPVARSSRGFRAGHNRRLIGLRALEPRRKRRWRKPGRTNRVRGRCGRRLGGHPPAGAAASGASEASKAPPVASRAAPQIDTELSRSWQVASGKVPGAASPRIHSLKAEFGHWDCQNGTFSCWRVSGSGRITCREAAFCLVATMEH